VKSILETLRRSNESCALVFFTPYRPWLLDKDLDFFRVAKENSLHIEKILEKELDNVMFENDPGVSHFATEEPELTWIVVREATKNCIWL
jgi:nicotinamide N-methyltransferase